MEVVWKKRTDGTNRWFQILDDGTSITPLDLSDALNEQNDNSVKHNIKDNKLTPERERLHNKIINDYFKDAKPYKEGDKKIALFTGGGPASGKGGFIEDTDGNSTIDKFYSKNDNPVVVDPDKIKNLLKQYDTKDPKAKVNDSDTGYYHEESSLLAKRIYDIAIRKNYPILFDGTATGLGSLMKKINLAEKFGYKCEMSFCLSNLNTVIDNAVARFSRTGRLVNYAEMLNMHKKAANIINQLAPHFNKIRVYDNSNHDYKLVASGSNKSNLVINNEFKFNSLINQDYSITDSGRDAFYGRIAKVKSR